MKKLWFYFNTIQLASTFTDFHLVKLPANVSMVKKSYENIIHVKPIPDELMVKLKAQFGITSSINTTEHTEGEETHRRLQTISKSRVLKNQIALGVCALALVGAIIVVIVYRKKVWAKLHGKIKSLLTSIYSMFIWNGVVRALLELFYPTMLAAFGAIAKDWHQKGKLVMPLA